MDFIWSYRIADFVQYLLALQKITGPVEFYKVLWSLYNIKQPCMNLPDLWKSPDLWTLICSYRIADFVKHRSALEKMRTL